MGDAGGRDFGPAGPSRTFTLVVPRRPTLGSSPNALRRSFANWHVDAGVPLFAIAQAMSQGTRLLEGVYGLQSLDQLAATIAPRSRGGEVLLHGPGNIQTRQP